VAKLIVFRKREKAEQRQRESIARSPRPVNRKRKSLARKPRLTGLSATHA